MTRNFIIHVATQYRAQRIILSVGLTIDKQQNLYNESEEAKAVPLAAASGDRRTFTLRHMGGQIIQAGGQQLIPEGNQRKVARWMGGLEDL
jgi:hypothetical protein